MIAAFDIIDKTIELEGGFVDHPSDRGGKTMYGLSTRWNPLLADKIASQTLTIQEARQYYYDHYYKVIYRINDLPAPLRFIIFDQRVHGSDSVSYLQQWLNVVLQNKVKLKVDGVYGAKTFAAINLVDWNAQFMNLITYLESTAIDSGKATAARMVAGQQLAGLPVYDFSNGMIHRFKKRYAIACEMREINV